MGSLACSKCDFKATEKCQTALKLDAHKFVIVSGKAGEDLFNARCSGKLVRVSGAVTLKDGQVTITGAQHTKLDNQVTLAGKLACSKCDFNIGKCAAALKAGDLQVLLEGDAAKALFKARCSGKPKVATGALTKIDGNTVYLKVSKIVDPETPTPQWQPVLAKSFKGDTKDLRVKVWWSTARSAASFSRWKARARTARPSGPIASTRTRKLGNKFANFAARTPSTSSP